MQSGRNTEARWLLRTARPRVYQSGEQTENFAEISCQFLFPDTKGNAFAYWIQSKLIINRSFQEVIYCVIWCRQQRGRISLRMWETTWLRSFNETFCAHYESLSPSVWQHLVALFVNMFPTALIRPLKVCNACIHQASSSSFVDMFSVVRALNVRSNMLKAILWKSSSFSSANFIFVVVWEQFLFVKIVQFFDWVRVASAQYRKGTSPNHFSASVT